MRYLFVLMMAGCASSNNPALEKDVAYRKAQMSPQQAEQACRAALEQQRLSCTSERATQADDAACYEARIRARGFCY